MGSCICLMVSYSSCTAISGSLVKSLFIVEVLRCLALVCWAFLAAMSWDESGEVRWCEEGFVGGGGELGVQGKQNC